MYSRIIDNQTYSFGVSGKLIRNTLVMYDRETGTLWSQLLGEAIEGELRGTTLAFVPAVHTTWQDWRTQNPDTLALVKGYSGGRDSYQSYYNSGSAGVRGETFQDDRLYVKEFVVGVADETAAVAFPFSVLNDQPVVNDTVGTLPVLVLFYPDTGASRVFDRRLDGETLVFSRDDAGRLIDETGTRWSETGLGEAGSLAGKQLTPVKSTSSFWFGWKDWYPETAVFGLAEG